MHVRSGGSYVVDAESGKERRVAATEQPDANRVEPADVAPGETAPAAAPPEPEAEPSPPPRRRAQPKD